MLAVDLGLPTAGIFFQKIISTEILFLMGKNWKQVKRHYFLQWRQMMRLDAQPCRDGTWVILVRSAGTFPPHLHLAWVTLVQALHSCRYIVSPRYDFDCLNQLWCSRIMKYYTVVKNENGDPNALAWKEVQNMWSKLNKQCTKIDCAEDFAKSLI